jgi:hypothetical protein
MRRKVDKRLQEIVEALRMGITNKEIARRTEAPRDTISRLFTGNQRSIQEKHLQRILELADRELGPQSLSVSDFPPCNTRGRLVVGDPPKIRRRSSLRNSQPKDNNSKELRIPGGKKVILIIIG